MTHNKLTLKIKLEQLNEVLQVINNTFFRKRIKNELQMLYEDNRDINIYFDNDDEKHVRICIKDKGKGRSYTFLLNTFSYPFTRPDIYVNNQNYYTFLKINSEYERNMVKQFTGVECFTCYSIASGNNWNPLVTLKNVIDEINNIYKIRKNILYKIISKKIKEKYLLPEIDLDSWLF